MIGTKFDNIHKEFDKTISSPLPFFNRNCTKSGKAGLIFVKQILRLQFLKQNNKPPKNMNLRLWGKLGSPAFIRRPEGSSVEWPEAKLEALLRRSFGLSMEGLGGGGGEEGGKIWRIQNCFWSHLCLYSFWKWGVVPHFPFPSFTFTFWWLCHCGWCHSLSVYHLKRRRLPWKLVENKCPKFQIQFNGSQKSKATENQTSRRAIVVVLHDLFFLFFFVSKK